MEWSKWLMCVKIERKVLFLKVLRDFLGIHIIVKKNITFHSKGKTDFPYTTVNPNNIQQIKHSNLLITCNRRREIATSSTSFAYKKKIQSSYSSYLMTTIISQNSKILMAHSYLNSHLWEIVIVLSKNFVIKHRHRI